MGCWALNLCWPPTRQAPYLLYYVSSPQVGQFNVCLMLSWCGEDREAGLDLGPVFSVCESDDRLKLVSTVEALTRRS